MARAPSKISIKKETIELMEQDGTYKPLYDDIIEVYADTLYQYRKLTKQFEAGDRKTQTETAANGYKTAPLVKTIENLRKDLMQLSDRLQLNPKSNPAPKNKKVSASPLRSMTSKYGT